ncbi:voltage-dependent anion channel-domain-containing protein [Abortiporus biennis]|nr:voltage-dependent anion channel-domain-containing protein [Abortiporus biennis]
MSTTMPRSNATTNTTFKENDIQTSESSVYQTRQVQVNVISRRIHGWTWQAFPIGMGTGAVYVCLAGIKDHPGGVLTIVENIFFFFNIVLFLLNTCTLSLQLILYPRQARRLITDPATGIFVPLIVLSFATIIIGTVNYGVPNHVGPGFIYILFWIYIGFAVVVCFPMLMIWFNKPHDLTTFTPAWAFLVFPMMLAGVVAFNVLKVTDPSTTRALGVLLTGYIFQGLGFFMTLFYICIYIIRIMTTGFLAGHQASGAFVACGPPGFTALALINLGDASRNILSSHNLVSSVAGEVWYATSVMAALLLFGLAVFFFAFGALPYWFKLHRRLGQILGCWALTFPNVGWILTLRKLGDIFNIEAFHIWHLIMTVLMCITWLILFCLTVIAFCKGKIFMASPEDIIKDTVDRKREFSGMIQKLDYDIERALFRGAQVAASMGPPLQSLEVHVEETNNDGNGSSTSETTATMVAQIRTAEEMETISRQIR